MGLTMSEKVQAARDRALLISQQDADAPRLTDRLDAQSLAVLVEAFDATRAKLAECEQKAESYDLTHTGDWFERAHALGQRDPAKYAGRDIWHVAVEMAESLAEVERERDEARTKVECLARSEEYLEAEFNKRLAASQAREARLRELLSAGWCRNCTYERGHADRVQAALASAPGSMDALQAVCERVGEASAFDAAMYATGDGPTANAAARRVDVKAIVSRILGERSDDAPQGRGERGKEAGRR